MRPIVVSALAAGTLWCTVACSANDPGPVYAYVSFTDASVPPNEVELGQDLVRIPVGIAVRVILVPIGDDDQPLQGEVAHVALRSANPDVLKVVAGPDSGQLILIGTRTGATALIASIQGVEVDAIPVEVTAQ